MSDDYSCRAMRDKHSPAAVNLEKMRSVRLYVNALGS